MENVELDLLWFVLIVLVISLASVLRYRHIPRHEITWEIENEIITKGLIHFTYYGNAVSIQSEGLVPQRRKPMYNKEKNMVWMYLYDEENIGDKYEVIRRKGERKNYDAYVVIREISKSQIKKMRYRKSDMAIVHAGILKTESMEVKKI